MIVLETVNEVAEEFLWNFMRCYGGSGHCKLGTHSKRAIEAMKLTNASFLEAAGGAHANTVIQWSEQV